MSEPWFEVAFDRLYPIVYHHRDEGEARRAVASFAGLFAGKEPVLDLACGSGRYMAALAGVGVGAFGVDLSAFLLEEATRNGAVRNRVVRADMRNLPIREDAVGGVINMFTSFGYFETDAENLGVLEETARVLRPKGVFLFDFINAGTVSSSLCGTTTRSQDGFVIDESRSLEDGDRRLVKRVTATQTSGGARVEYEERLRLYRRDELRSMLAGAGLDVSHECGDYDQGAFDPARSPRLIMICERRAN